MKQQLARRNLDNRIAPLRGMRWTRPQKGWVRAIRDAMGITAAAMASRLKVSQPRIAKLEQGEVNDTLTIASLRAAAAALDCELVYALIPRIPLEAAARERAEAIADEQLRWSSHTMALENQSVAADKLEEERARLIAELLTGNAQRLWKHK